MSTSIEKNHMNAVANIGCILCRHMDLGTTAAELHHVREGQGMAQRASNFLVVPLCPEHHRGASGLHGLGTRGFYTRYRLDELDLLAMTIEVLSKRSGR
ncbi:MAG TPA: Ref family recombination enhancement nuclease [Noviherbaspirillum sp.]|nr:Ref family recombination enhancement nuclease [Noviherbaspirillum sp.]